MSNEEKILEILSAMQGDISSMKEDIAGLKQDVAGLKQDVAELKEDVAILKDVQEDHTAALNELLAWAEEVQVVVRVPFARSEKIISPEPEIRAKAE